MTVRLRFILILIAAPLVLGVGQRSHRTGTVSVQLLAINDFHGNLEPPTGDSGLVNTMPAGGAEYLATHLQAAAREEPNSIIVAAGDLIGASPLVSALFHNEPAIESMNAMNLAVASVGNHEFDRGRSELLRMKQGGCHPKDGCQDGDGFDGARFQYLSANVVDNNGAKPRTLFPATAIRTIGGVKVGFIGETLKGTKQIVIPIGVRGLSFLDEASTANVYAARLKRQGVNAIVLLIHEGGRQKTDTPEVAVNGCANFSGALVPILDKLSPDIKVVISGHTHRYYNCTIAGRLVTSAGSYGRMFTRVNLTIDAPSDSIVSSSASNQIVTRDVEKDPVQTQLISKYGPLSKPVADRVVGRATATISRMENRAGESALGDVIADAQLLSAKETIKGGAAVAFMNPGGIRAEIVVGRTTTDGGAEVTYGQLFGIHPFSNVVTGLTLSGAAIKQVLEQQFDNPGPGETTMLQVSEGFTYGYALDAPAGRRVDASSIKIGGRVVSPTDSVRVAANDFLVAGGDNFSAFERGTNRMPGSIDVDALVRYFQIQSPVRPGQQNRIVRTD